MKKFPKIWFDLNQWFGFISSYEEFNLAIESLVETKVFLSRLDSVNYFLDSFLHVGDSVDFTNMFLYKNSDTTFRELAKANLDEEELAKFGIIL